MHSCYVNLETMHESHRGLSLVLTPQLNAFPFLLWLQYVVSLVTWLENVWLLEMLLDFLVKANRFFFFLQGRHRSVSVERKICRKFADTRL